MAMTTGAKFCHHAVCDLVLVQHKAGGQAVGNDLDIQIRTRGRTGYSDVKRVAIKIGNNDTLEVDADSGLVQPQRLQGSIGSTGNGYELTLPNGAYVRILDDGESLGVQIRGDSSVFGNSEGLCGSWKDGGINDRDGNAFDISSTTPETILKLAQEWRVDNTLHGDKILFSVPDPVARCMVPSGAPSLLRGGN